MKSTHRTQAKAKRSQRTHYVMTYGLLDTLFASPDAPMPAEKRRHQLTRMYGGLRALETAPPPSPARSPACTVARPDSLPAS